MTQRRFPNCWRLIPLSTISRIQGGFAFKSKEYQNQGIPIVRISNVKVNGLDWSNTVYWTSDLPESLKKYLLKPQDILISMTGEVGVTTQIQSSDIPSLLNQRVGRFVINDNSSIDPDFLFYVTQSIDFINDIRSAAFGAIQLNISADRIENVKIPLPPLDEQKSISRILKAVQVAIQTRRDEFELERERKSALMEYLFTYGTGGSSVTTKKTKFGSVPQFWKMMPLNECAFVQTGIAKGRKLAGKNVLNLPYLRVANVQDGYLDLSEIKNIELRESEIERYMLQSGDVVVTEGGDFDKLGRGFLWKAQIPICVHQNHIFAVRVNRNILIPEYFAYLIQSKYGKAYFLSVAHRTTNLASINSTKLKAFPTLVPSLTEQKEIVNFIDACDAKIASLEQELVLLAELFHTLLEGIMSGQISILPLIQMEQAL